MDAKEVTLAAFYGSVDRTRVKLETARHGEAYLRALAARAAVDYCELKKGVYKYRLSDVTPDFFDELLSAHVTGELNLCTYFGRERGNLCAVNLDGAEQDDTVLKVAALYLIKAFVQLQISPLVLCSGHGYHLLCRTDAPVENGRLRAFCAALRKGATEAVRGQGLDPGTLRCTVYPRADDDISLRLFGTRHARTGEFSRVVTGIAERDTLLSEAESWDYFADYLRDCTLSAEQFEEALKKVVPADS